MVPPEYKSGAGSDVVLSGPVATALLVYRFGAFLYDFLRAEGLNIVMGLFGTRLTHHGFEIADRPNGDTHRPSTRRKREGSG